MVMVVVLSHIIFVEVNPWFQTGCQTRLSRYPQSFFFNPRCLPGVVPTEVMTINVRLGEAMIASEREVPAAILEMDITEVGRVRNLMSLARAKGCILPVLVEPCSSTHVLYPHFLLFCNQAP